MFAVTWILGFFIYHIDFIVHLLLLLSVLSLMLGIAYKEEKNIRFISMDRFMWVSLIFYQSVYSFGIGA